MAINFKVEKPHYVYIIDFGRRSLVEKIKFVNNPWLQRLNRMGLVHRTYEDAKEAADRMLFRTGYSDSARLVALEHLKHSESLPTGAVKVIEAEIEKLLKSTSLQKTTGQ